MGRATGESPEKVSLGAQVSVEVDFSAILGGLACASKVRYVFCRIPRLVLDPMQRIPV